MKSSEKNPAIIKTGSSNSSGFPEDFFKTFFGFNWDVVMFDLDLLFNCSDQLKL